MTRIAILDDYQDAARRLADWARLPADAELVVFRDHLADPDAVAARLAGFDVVVAMRERTPFPRALLERLPQLRLLVTTGMRNAAIDLAGRRRSRRRRVRHRRPPLPDRRAGVGADPLAHAAHPARGRGDPRGRLAGDGRARARRQDPGLLGLGTLGSRVARFGRAFEMEVLAWSQNLTAERATELGATRVERDELLAAADMVSIHLVLSDRTRGLIGARRAESDEARPRTWSTPPAARSWTRRR